MEVRIPKKSVYAAGFILLLWIAFGIGKRIINTVPTRTLPTNADTSNIARSNKTGTIREIAVIARQFEFSPNPIRVRLGENIRLRITSTDVNHGFSLPAFGINETLSPGQTATVEFQATKKGEFPFTCSVVCGSGHSGMRGTLIVQ